MTSEERDRVGTHHRGGEWVIYWSLPFVAAIWVAAFLLFPGFLPPMSPEATAAEVAAFYNEDLSRIRYSMILFNWFGPAMVPMILLIVERMRGMTHRTPILRYCVIGVAGALPIDLLTSTVFWMIAAFRPDRSPDLIVMTNDLAWITYVAAVPFFIALCLFIAMAIAYDDQPDPVFPAWVATFNVVIAISVIPAGFAGLTLTGPIAWDGFLSFWVRNVSFTLWLVVMVVVLRRAMQRDLGVENEARDLGVTT